MFRSRSYVRLIIVNLLFVVIYTLAVTEYWGGGLELFTSAEASNIARSGRRQRIIDVLVSPDPGAETYAAGCGGGIVTDFNLGDTVCGKITDSSLGPPVQRQFQWVDPSNVVRQLAPDVTTNPQTSNLIVPSTTTSTVGGLTFDNRGTWKFNDNRVSDAGQQATTSFRVHDPARPAADLSISASASPNPVGQGMYITFQYVIKNGGPDPATSAVFTLTIPAGTTFVSATSPSGWSCGAPAGATVTCTRGLMPADPIVGAPSISFSMRATFPNPSADGTQFTSTGTISSATEDLVAADNQSSASTIVGPVPTAAGVSVSGQVLSAQGRGVRNAFVTITDSHGDMRQMKTGVFGTYRFDEVQAGSSYVITVRSRRFSFEPRAVDVSDNLSDFNFIAQ